MSDDSGQPNGLEPPDEARRAVGGVATEVEVQTTV
jgi:hypothetical protein